MDFNMNRRRALGAAGFLAAGAALTLAGCKNQTTDQLTADVNLLSSGLSGIVTQLSDPALKVPPNVIAQVQKALTDLQMNAAQIGTSLTPNANAIQTISTAVSTIASLAMPFFAAAPQFAPVVAIVQAALALLPAIVAFVGAPTPAPAAKAARSMTPDQARLVLQDAPATMTRRSF